MYAESGDISQHCRLRTPPLWRLKWRKKTAGRHNTMSAKSHKIKNLFVVKIRASSVDIGREGRERKLVVINGARLSLR